MLVFSYQAKSATFKCINDSENYVLENSFNKKVTFIMSEEIKKENNQFKAGSYISYDFTSNASLNHSLANKMLKNGIRPNKYQLCYSPEGKKQ
jgi:hypothetical protein